jgi:hypothetical protein
MKAIIALCVLFVGAYCAPMLDEKLGTQWALFKNTHKKQYNSIEEEIARYVIQYFNFSSYRNYISYLQPNYLGS